MFLPLCNFVLIFRGEIKVEKNICYTMKQNINREILIEWADFIQAVENIIRKWEA